jgi:predicted deacylase
MVVAGLHGDEPSGTAAARRVISGPPPARGSIVAIPAAAPEALAEGKRWAAGRSDLNRAFPVAAGKGRDRGADTSQSPCVFQDPTFDRAEALLNLIALERPALVLDLHESSRYWTEGDKPALVVPRSLEAAEIALRLLESTWLAGFSFTGPPPAGSLAAAADGILGIPALIVEVPGAMDADERIAVHLRVIRAALEILGMAPGRDTPVKSGRRE